MIDIMVANIMKTKQKLSFLGYTTKHKQRKRRARLDNFLQDQKWLLSEGEVPHYNKPQGKCPKTS